MASAYGIIHQYGEPQSAFDTNLALQALSYKQQRYDANEVKIEQVMQNFGIKASGMNAAGKKYLYDRLTQMTDGIKNADLSSSRTTQNILGAISSSVDDTVLGHLSVVNKKNQFDEEVKKAKEDGTFSDVNYQDALITSGYLNYLNSEDPNDYKVGNMEYTPYINVDQELTKIAKDKLSLYKDKIREDLSDNGLITKYTKRTFSPTQWSQILRSSLTPQMLKQIGINTRKSFGWDKDTAIQIIGDDYLKQKDRYKSTLTTLQTKLKNSTGEQKKLIQKRINYISELSDDFNERYNKIDKSNIWDGLTMMRVNSVIENMSDKLGSEAVSREYSNVPKEDGDTQDKKELELLHNFRVTPRESEFKETDTDQLFNTLTESKDQYSDLLNKFRENLSDEDKKDLQTLLPEYKKEHPDETDEDALYSVLSNLKGVKNLNYSGWADLTKARRRSQNVYNVIGKTSEEASKRIWDLNYDKIYDILNENYSHINVVNSSGNNIDVLDYLKRHGINNKEDFKRFLSSDSSKDFKSQVYAGMFLDNKSAYPAKGQVSARPRTGLIPSLSSYSGETFSGSMLDKPHLRAFRNMKRINGEDVNLTDVFNFYDKNNNLLSQKDVTDILKDGGGSNIHFTFKGGDTQTERYIKNAYKNDNYRVSAGLSLPVDNSFMDDNDLFDIFSYDNYLNEFNKILPTNSIHLRGFNRVYLDMPETSSDLDKHFLRNRVKELRAIVSAGTLGDEDEELWDISYKEPVGITTQKSEDGRMQFIVSQTSGGKEHSVIVSPQTFQDLAPDMFSQFQLSQESNAGQMDFGENSKLSVTNLSYADIEDGNRQKVVNNVSKALGNPKLADLAINKTAEEYLRNEFGYKQGSTPDQLVSKVINNSDLFRVDLHNLEDNSKAVDVYFNKNGDKKDPDWQIIENLPISGVDMDNVDKLYRIAPQAFLSLSLESLMDQYVASQGANDKEMTDLLKNLTLIEKVRNAK